MTILLDVISTVGANPTVESETISGVAVAPAVTTGANGVRISDAVAGTTMTFADSVTVGAKEPKTKAAVSGVTTLFAPALTTGAKVLSVSAFTSGVTV
jgi:hypothetical protein